MEAVLSVSRLSKSFGERTAAKDVSFDVFPGEIFGLIGENGAGKTTVLKMILGLTFADSGTVTIGGESLNAKRRMPFEKVGAVTEEIAFFDYLSGRKNLEMARRLHSGVASSRVEEVASLCGIKEALEVKVGAYSLGMKKRLALACALLPSPELLVLDEPTNALDPSGMRDLRALLARLSEKEGVAVLLSSHILSEMQELCDRAGILSKGRLVGVKPMKEWLEMGKSVPVFRFLTAHGEEAKALLSDKRESVRSVSPEYIDLALAEEEVPLVLEKLVAGHLAIFGVSRMQPKLEDIFLSLVEGDKND